MDYLNAGSVGTPVISVETVSRDLTRRSTRTRETSKSRREEVDGGVITL
jgi:hypothetical protein